MTDFSALLKDLRRPRLLIRAARHGLCDYRRERDLRRLIRIVPPPSPDRALRALLNEEAEIERNRRAGDARYSVGRHIEILIALMAEFRLLPQSSG
jgi:hypothetical protein